MSEKDIVQRLMNHKKICSEGNMIDDCYSKCPFSNDPYTCMVPKFIEYLLTGDVPKDE